MNFDETDMVGVPGPEDRSAISPNENIVDSRNRLVVALDVATEKEAMRLVELIGDAVGFYKIGLELVFGGGLNLAKRLKSNGNLIFFDMKLLDIGNTVEKAVANVALLGFDYLTVHGVDRKTLSAAVRGRGSSSLKLLSVTVLTDLDDSDLSEQGIEESARPLVIRRAKMARDCGFDGVIASGHEATAIREATDTKFIIKTPGIRPAGGALGDQKRVMTPSAALRAGANYLVVGRPITEAPNPRVAALSIQAEIALTLKDMDSGASGLVF